MPSKIDVAWAAGLFEGEGCIHLARPTAKRVQPRLEIRMTDQDVLERFCQVVERGSVQSRPYDQAPNSLKRVWKWGVYDCEGARHVLNLIWPHLGKRRKKKAEEVLHAIRHMQSKKEVLTHN